MPSGLTWSAAATADPLGSKNGSFFLLDLDGLGLHAQRQMLPCYGNPASAIPATDRHGSPTATFAQAEASTCAGRGGASP